MTGNDMTVVDMNKYQELLQCLKKNKENVPPELLLTKYEKPYNRLRNEIANMTSRIVKDIALFGWKVERDEVPEVCAIVNSVTKESGIMRDVGHAVYQEQNVDKVLNCAALLRILIYQKMKERENGDKEESDPSEKTAHLVFHLRAGDLRGSCVHKNQKTDGIADTL